MNTSSIYDQVIYFRSGKVYTYPICEQKIFYLPPAEGLPIVGDTFVGHVLDFFSGGESIKTAFEHFSQKTPYSREEIISVILLLKDKHYIKKCDDNGNYKAFDISLNDVKEINIWCHITNNCNLACPYCFVNNKSNASMSEKTIKESIKKIITTVQQRGITNVNLRFGGGEPTLVMGKVRSFYSKLSNPLKKMGVRLTSTIISNGTLITSEVIDFLKNYNVGLSVSLDGFGEEGHDIYRKYKYSGKGTWKTISNNLKKLKLNGIPIYTGVTLSQKTCEHVLDLVKWCLSIDGEIALNPVMQPAEIWNLDCKARKAYNQYCDKLIIAFTAIFEELKKPSYSVDVLRKVLIPMLNFKYPNFSILCGRGIYDITIQHDGTLVACPSAIGETSISPGTNLLDDIQKNFSITASIRNKNPDDSCLKCEWFPICSGGCPDINQKVYGSPFAQSPLCKFFKYIIPEYIKFFGTKLIQYAKIKNLTHAHILHMDVANV